MPSTDIEIINMAFTRCGASPITALDDANDKARLALEYYEPTVQLTLRKHPWNFAVKRVSLAQDTETPVNEWAHQYTLPADPYCLRVLQINEGRDNYVIEGRKILTDAATVYLRYVARVNETEFDPMFVRVLVLELAATFTYRLTISEAQRNSIIQELQQIVLPDARFADAMEEREPVDDVAVNSIWIAARYGRMT